MNYLSKHHRLSTVDIVQVMLAASIANFTFYFFPFEIKREWRRQIYDRSMYIDHQEKRFFDGKFLFDNMLPLILSFFKDFLGIKLINHVVT